MKHTVPTLVNTTVKRIPSIGLRPKVIWEILRQLLGELEKGPIPVGASSIQNGTGDTPIIEFLWDLQDETQYNLGGALQILGDFKRVALLGGGGSGLQCGT